MRRRIGTCEQWLSEHVRWLWKSDGKAEQRAPKKMGRHAATWHEIFQKGDRGVLVLKEGVTIRTLTVSTNAHQMASHCWVDFQRPRTTNAELVRG